MRDWAAARVRDIGQHLSIHSSKQRSRSPSPAPTFSSGRNPEAEAKTPYPQALPNKQPAATPPTLAQKHPTPTALPQTLSPLEIRQRTAELLKKRLAPEEVEKIKWGETTEEQAKDVVEKVHKSLEGKPEHTGKMYKTLQYIDMYAKIIDVAIQHQPCITALVWAGVRTVIQVCGNFLFVNLYPRHYEVSQCRQFSECADRCPLHRAWNCLFGYFPHTT